MTPRKAISFDMVRIMGLALPGVEEGTTYGTPALKVGGKMFACVPSHRSAEPGSLAVRIAFDQRDELIAAEPDTYYVKEHYVPYPCVLVRLARIRRVVKAFAGDGLDAAGGQEILDPGRSPGVGGRSAEAGQKYLWALARAG